MNKQEAIKTLRAWRWNMADHGVPDFGEKYKALSMAIEALQDEKKKHTIGIECETKGFEEATEKVEVLASAYDSFPPQVTVRNCRDCVVNIHPSQTKIIIFKDDDMEGRDGTDDNV